jgi:hypothetical protein
MRVEKRLLARREDKLLQAFDAFDHLVIRPDAAFCFARCHLDPYVKRAGAL